MSAFHDSEVCRGILESLPIGLCVVDMQKKIVFWSDGAERITGHLRHEVIGRSCSTEGLLHCDHPGCEFCNEEGPLVRSMKTSHAAEAIGYLHHKAGHEVPVRIRAVAVHNAHGSIIGAVETFEDQPHAANLDHGNFQQPGCMDEVTGTLSRAMMQAHLREALRMFAETQAPFAVLCLRLEGLDHFRASVGPEAASSLLRAVARTVEAALGKADFVGRWSGDQFLALLNGSSEAEMTSVRERIRHMLASDAIEWWGERRSLPVTIGQATPLPNEPITALLDRAQQSLEAFSAEHTKAAAACGTKSSGS